MIKELKKVVKLNSKIINVGEWDYQEYSVVVNQKQIDDANKHNASVENEEDYVEVPSPIIEVRQENPLPDGAVVEEVEMTYTEEHGWRETNWIQPLTQEEKIAKLEQEKEKLAETLDMVLTEIIPSILGGI